MNVYLVQVDVRLAHNRRSVTLLPDEPVRTAVGDGGRSDARQGRWLDAGGPQTMPVTFVDGGAP